jgi:hypothetical protein
MYEGGNEINIGSRPGTSNGRPGTASGRPGTASGSRLYGNTTEFATPALIQKNSSNTILKELTNDSLLRIMSTNESKYANDLIMLAETGDLKGVRNLISTGVDITSIRGLDGFTPLHHASNRAHPAIVLELLRSNMPVNITNASGETALHLAAYAGNLLIVEQLLDCGADIDAKNDYGETALFYAARRSMPAVVRLLLQRGASTAIQDNGGEVAVDHALDERTISMFASIVPVTSGKSITRISLQIIQNIFTYLVVKDIGRAACVCGKWHRASESEEVWNRLGKRRWEFALQGYLGFTPAVTASFRPKSKTKKKTSESKK